jgi:hypothetical protein
MGIQNMVKLGKKKSNLVITIVIVLIILLFIGGWFNSESMDDKCGRVSDIIRVKMPVVDKIYNNSEGHPVHVIEIQLYFLPDHVELNWLGKKRQVQRPFEGTIIHLDFNILHGGYYTIWLDNSSYRTEDYLQNSSKIKAAFIKERNNGDKGWKSSDGILSANLNLDKNTPPFNYSLGYHGQVLAGVRDLPPNHIKLPYDGGLWGVEQGCMFYFNLQMFNTTG